MSALGQKQTCAAQKVMSALPPKADMCGATGMSAKCRRVGADPTASKADIEPKLEVPFKSRGQAQGQKRHVAICHPV